MKKPLSIVSKGFCLIFGATASFAVLASGAENETRTRDPNLGKVVLYQLSYFRNYVMNSSNYAGC